jgi:hypothetical protein
MKLKIAKNELDFTQKPTLNKDFWQNEKLNPKVRKAVLTIVKNYLKSTNLRLSIDNIDEIEFTGSLANYNYNKFSDVDIHLLFDFSELGNDPDFMRELLIAKAINWNNQHNITIFGYEVELYITDTKSDHHSTGVYSIKNDKWLVKPVKDTKLSAELNLNKIKNKADKISKQINMLVVKNEISLEKIESLKDKIKKMRESGLEDGGEYSTENLAFKLLRRRGELNTLYTLMNHASDAEHSLDEGTEWWKKRRKLDNKNYRELMGYVSGKRAFKRKYAAKNTGYPKSVSRKKLSKLGAPYTMDPPRRLPKSAPPGIAESLLKEYTGKVEKAAENIKAEIDSGKPFNLTLNKRAFGQFKCLNEHTYEIKREGEKYNLKLKDSVEAITTEIAKKYKNAGRIDPISRCVYYSGEAIINSQVLNSILLSELGQGNVKDIPSAPPLPVPPEPKAKPKLKKQSEAEPKAPVIPKERKPETSKEVEIEKKPKTPEKTEPEILKKEKPEIPKEVKKGSIFVGNSQRFSFAEALIKELDYPKPLKIFGASVAKPGSSPKDWTYGKKKKDLEKFLKDNKTGISLVGLAFGDHRTDSSNTDIIGVIRQILPNVKIVWQGPPPIWKTLGKKTWSNNKRRSNSKAIAKKATSLNFEFINPYNYITKNDKNLYRDHVHLKPAGVKELLGRYKAKRKTNGDNKKVIGSVAAMAKNLNSKQRKNAAIIESVFRAAGFSDRAIAAAIVNAMHESAGMHSYTVGDGGSSVGLFQLNRGSDKKPFWGLDPKMTKQTREKYRKLAQDNTLNPKFWNTSLKLYKGGLLQDFIKDRLKAGDWRFDPEENTKGILSDRKMSQYKKADKDGKTFLELVEMFLTKIERAGDPLLPKRIALAKKMFPSMSNL